jgi:hypothetical protein
MSEHDHDDCPNCNPSPEQEMYERIETALVTFLEQSFDEKAFPATERNITLVAKVLMHRTAHLAIDADVDLPSFVANAAHEMIEAQRCVMTARLQERLGDVLGAVMERGNKKPEDMN